MRIHRSALPGLIGMLTLGGWGSGAARADTPTTLVSAGVTQVGYPGNPYVLSSDPATFWYTQPTCGAGAPTDGSSPAIIQRGSGYGATPRKILEFNPPRGASVCNPYRLASNLAVDGTDLFFVDNQGPGGHWALQRRSRGSNSLDASIFLADLGTSLNTAEVNAEYPGILFVILHRPGLSDVIFEYGKATGVLINANVETAPADTLRNLQYDGKYLYWINGSVLRANDTTNGSKRTIASGGISAYLTEGFYEGQCSPLGCEDNVAFVVYGQNNRILLTDAVNPGGYPPSYTSTDPNATIQAITRDTGDLLYFVERRAAVPGGVFDREDRVFRLGSQLALLYGPVNNGGPGFDGFTTDLTYLYFHDRAAKTLLRLPNNAAALPVYALRGTGIEVTQGIQNPANDVSLYAGRRTFVRFYVKSDNQSYVGGVTAYLDVYGQNGYLGRLEPVNRVGKLLAIRNDPKRANLDDSFLFELPLAWTSQSRLQVQGIVNPLAAVVEDKFQDNTATSPILPVSDSPRINVEIVDFRYLYAGNLVTGGVTENYDSFDYMNRIYPLAVPGGGIADPGVGLHRNISVVWDDAMAAHVDRTSPDCAPLLVTNPDKTVTDDRNECAGFYALATIQSMRSAGDIPKDRYYYGAIAIDASVPNSKLCGDGKTAAQCLTRGFTPSGETISVGPRLDFSGPQQNYMSHEIGHALGRGHPSSGANPVCPGQSAGDASFPYPNGRIGNSSSVAGNETAHMGFDPGQAGNVNQPMQLRPAFAGVNSSGTGDVMSYCTPNWISSYTYGAIWTKLSFFPLAASLPLAAGAPAAAAAAGDWLLAFGNFSVSSQQGSFVSVRRLDAVADVPVLVAGDYALELRNAGGALLASHPFTPVATDEASPDRRSFGLVVDFVPGTRSIRIVQRSTSKVVATRPVSPSRPVVSNVALVGASSPVTGTVTLDWTANDADGGALLYDVLYSHDGGASWRPLRRGLSDTTASLDTTALGGGTGVLRVEANDGAQSGRADSASFAVATKPPATRIQTPAGEIQIQWGQLVNFLGDAPDPQEQPIPESGFVWSSPYRTLGTGRAITVTDLEVGSYLVTLSARNAAGLTATATVPVVVGDRISYPGPRLSATPSAISWGVDGDSSTTQTATLQVANVGGNGTLPFTATATPDWIHVNGATDITASAPTALAVTADPSGLPEGQTSSGQITLAHTGDPADTITIPVTVAKGQAFLGVPPADADGDGVPDAQDNCPFAANVDQTDTGGIGAGSTPDGVGDACQCGDVSGDGRVTVTDAVLMTRSLLQPPTETLAHPERCDVGSSASCSIADALIVRRALLLPPTAAIQQVCAPANP